MSNIKKILLLILISISGIGYAQKYEKENDFLEEKILEDNIDKDRTNQEEIKSKINKDFDDIDVVENEEIDYVEEDY